MDAAAQIRARRMTVTIDPNDQAAFEQLVAPYRRELHAHCYRMLGAFQDAEDAFQETLIGAWRGLDGFQGRSSVRSWLYRIATNACLKVIRDRPKRLLSADHRPATSETQHLDPPAVDEVWVEPYPEDGWDALDPQARYELRESVELAFVAALQHLPGTQRAVLILRDVLALSAEETAEQLDTSVASVNSALQRARKAVGQRVPERSQQVTLRELGEDAAKELVDGFVAAWERADVPALMELLVADARFTMPPLPAWFAGRDDVGRFLRTRIFETPWRLVPLRANGQLGFVGYQGQPDGSFRVGSVSLLTVRGRQIAEVTSFLDPAMYQAFDLPPLP